ncbi:MAG: PQQ-dependent sugar dehydrogenase [Pseudomonadota bacterium]
MLFEKIVSWVRSRASIKSNVLRQSGLTAVLSLLLLDGGSVLPQFDVQTFATGFSRPLLMKQVPGDDSRHYVVEQGGLLKVIENDVVQGTPFLDLAADGTDFEDECNEMGFLGLAFDPNYTTNGYLYVYYSSSETEITNCSGSSGAHTSIVSRFTRDGAANSNVVDESSELVILEIPQPYSNHNGGNIEFGQDGYLYIGLGDGGSFNDPDETAQDTTELLGSMLRIDVTDPTSGTYDIPGGNEFSGENCLGGGTGNCAEIYAWGLRNPWRWSFDRMTGELWLGDVGQGQWEEVSRVGDGDNMGWDCREGNEPFESTGCSGETFVDPVAQYSSSGGGNPDCSVTGGYVYRGSDIPELQGYYLFADYCSGIVRTVEFDAAIGSNERVLEDYEFFISSFAEDNQGELYIMNFFGGAILKIIPIAD